MPGESSGSKVKRKGKGDFVGLVDPLGVIEWELLTCLLCAFLVPKKLRETSRFAPQKALAWLLLQEGIHFLQLELSLRPQVESALALQVLPNAALTAGGGRLGWATGGESRPPCSGRLVQRLVRQTR